MNTKPFLSLCAVTAVAVVLAIISVGSQPSYESADAKGEMLFPTLVNDINRLKTVVVRSKEGTYNLDLNDQGWQFRERDNYAADDKKIAEMVLRMARMQKLEAKTKIESSYERLDLSDPDAKDSRAKQVTLIDKDGKTIADLIVGKRKFTLGSKDGGTYIRIPGDAQTWLALGELNPGEKARDWLKRDVADIKDKSIKRVTVTHPDGEKVTVLKTSPNDESFKIQGIPSGREPTTDFVADEVGRILSILMLDDVDKASDVPFPTGKVIKAEFEGFDGFNKVFVDLVEVDDKSWIKLRGESTTIQSAPKATPPPTAAAAPDAQPDVQTDWKSIIAELNARTEGWVFEIPGYEVAPLKKRMSDLTKKREAKS